MNHVKVTKEMLFQEINSYISDVDSIAMINKAYDYAQDKHKDQFRKSGEPYFVHLLNVAYILSTIKAGPQTICAGLLHDTMEDCGVSKEELENEFDNEIAMLVEAVTKIGNIQYKDLKEYQAANHRKIFIAMAKDIRVIIIKLVDRLHNMRTLNFMSPEKQKRISSETLEVYAPIAHRLGFGEIKNELEDLSFLYLDPEHYHEVAKLVEAKRPDRIMKVNDMIVQIDNLLAGKNINFRIFGRPKHLYSIYKKMTTKHKRFEEIYDLYAIRVVTESELNCYEILGYIHASFKPMSGRFKDYIAMPKVNMYQSLHTTIFDQNGEIFEIQIRTEEMDSIAENGVAAHWSYKEGKKYNSVSEQKEIENKLAWYKDLISIMDENSNANSTEFMNMIQKDIFEANVYVMSPMGRIIELPNGSTPLDFAYRIHTDVGNFAIGANINGVLVPLNTILKTGDVVSIRTSKQSAGPSEDWLKIVKTAAARNKIRAFLTKKENESRQEGIEKGLKILTDELRKRGLDDKEYTDKNHLEGIINSFQLSNVNELLYAISTKSVNLIQVIERLTNTKQTSSSLDNDTLTKMYQHREQERERANKNKKEGKTGILAGDISSMKISIAKCCMPVYGDDIIGYITKGQGIKAHRKDCPNIANEKTRLINVAWEEEDNNKQYEAWIRIDATDRNYLISDIVTCISTYKANLIGINSDSLPDGVHVYVIIKVKLADNNMLKLLMTNLKKLNAVTDVKRVIK